MIGRATAQGQEVMPAHDRADRPRLHLSEDIITR